MYSLNDVLTMKKTHPCGGNTWKVVRIGADIKVQCLTCGKYLNDTRDGLQKKVKKILRESGNAE